MPIPVPIPMPIAERDCLFAQYPRFAVAVTLNHALSVAHMYGRLTNGTLNRPWPVRRGGIHHEWELSLGAPRNHRMLHGIPTEQRYVEWVVTNSRFCMLSPKWPSMPAHNFFIF